MCWGAARGAEMSNSLAIATVTETLKQLLQAAADTDVPGTTVTVERPGHQQTQPPGSRISVFLYRVAPNAFLRNMAPAAHGPGGAPEQRMRVALDLDYLICVSGDNTQLAPHRLLGTVIRTLNGQPILTHQMISDALDHAPFGFLEGSDMSDQVDLVRLCLIELPLGELALLWSGLLQAPILLSVAYRAGIVFIDVP